MGDDISIFRNGYKVTNKTYRLIATTVGGIFWFQNKIFNSSEGVNNFAVAQSAMARSTVFNPVICTGCTLPWGQWGLCGPDVDLMLKETYMVDGRQ